MSIFSDQNIYAIKIHYVLLNEIKKVVQTSIENEIINRQNCKCQKDNCKCISAFFENNFNQKEESQDSKKKFYLKDIDSMIKEYFLNHQNYPNCLDKIDFTAIVSLSRNLLKINPKNGWISVHNLDEMSKDFSFGGCLNNVRNIRNLFYGHLNAYGIKCEDFDKIIKIFHEIVDRLPNLDKELIKKTKENIKLIIDKTQISTDEKEEFLKSSLEQINKILQEIKDNFDEIKDNVDEIKDNLNDSNQNQTELLNQIKIITNELENLKLNRKCLNSDDIDFSEDKNYIQRNEQEIIDLFVKDKSTDSKNKLILYEMGGFGKTWMAQYVSKKLVNDYNFIIKWFNSKTIEDSFRNVLIKDI